jgi:hypothetical protein
VTGDPACAPYVAARADVPVVIFGARVSRHNGILCEESRSMGFAGNGILNGPHSGEHFQNRTVRDGLSPRVATRSAHPYRFRSRAWSKVGEKHPQPSREKVPLHKAQSSPCGLILGHPFSPVLILWPPNHLPCRRSRSQDFALRSNHFPRGCPENEECPCLCLPHGLTQATCRGGPRDPEAFPPVSNL